jgi:hypothetical protein
MRGDSFLETAIVPEVVRRLAAIPDYTAGFDAAFGSAIITDETMLRAISAFERTLVTVPSYERFLAGDDTALTAQQKHGLDVFRRSGCSRCDPFSRDRQRRCLRQRDAGRGTQRSTGRRRTTLKRRAWSDLPPWRASACRPRSS